MIGGVVAERDELFVSTSSSGYNFLPAAVPCTRLSIGTPQLALHLSRSSLPSDNGEELVRGQSAAAALEAIRLTWNALRFNSRAHSLAVLQVWRGQALHA